MTTTTITTMTTMADRCRASPAATLEQLKKDAPAPPEKK